jgi:hypothetical protein
VTSSVTANSAMELCTQATAKGLENVGDVKEGSPEEEVRHECLRGK